MSAADDDRSMHVAELQTTPPSIATPVAVLDAADAPSLLASRWFWAGGLASVACWTLLWLALV
jgi:hypothetical protein